MGRKKCGLREISQYEENFNSIIPRNVPFIIKITGVSFKKLRQNLNLPIDTKLIHTMIKTTNYLLKKFRASTGYTSNNEILLIFTGAPDEYEVRVINLCSSIASTCSVYFNNIFLDILDDYKPGSDYEDDNDEYKRCNNNDNIQDNFSKEKIFDVIYQNNIYFTSTILLFHDKHLELVKYLKDITDHHYRIVISQYGKYYLTEEELYKPVENQSDPDAPYIISSGSIIRMFKDKNIDKIPFYIKNGVFSKYNNFDLNGNSCECTISNLSFKLWRSKKMFDILFDKTYPYDMQSVGHVEEITL